MNAPRPGFTVSGMGTATRDASSPSTTLISPRTTKTTLGVARLVLMRSAALLLVLGVVIWTGNGDELIPLHVLFGSTLVIALWVIAAIAAKAGVSRGHVGLAVAWSVVVPAQDSFSATLAMRRDEPKEV